MQLYLLRHAIAVERGTPGIETDAARPLTPKGRRKMEKLAQIYRESGLKVDQIVSSPYVRARETADIMARAYKLKVAIHDGLSPGLEPRTLKQELAELFPRSLGLMLVGHEPEMSEIACALIGAPSFSLNGIKKGGMVGLNLPSWESMATLEFLLTPRMLLGE